MEVNQFQFSSGYQKFICSISKSNLNLIILNSKQHQFYFQKTLNSQNYENQSNQLFRIYKTPIQLFQQLKRAFYFNKLKIQYNQICILGDKQQSQVKCLPLSKQKTTQLQRYLIYKMNETANKKHKTQIKKDLKQEFFQQNKQTHTKQKGQELVSNFDIQQQMMMSKSQKKLIQERLKQQAQYQNKDKVSHFQQSATLFLGNLSYQSTPQNMLQYFSKVGKVKQVRIIKDKNTGKSRGFGYVQYFDIDSAKRAYKLLNGQTFLTRQLRIDWASQKKD